MVKINDNYIVDVDENNYTLKRLTGRKTTRTDKRTGKTETTDGYIIVGYYGDLAGSIKGAIEDMNRQTLREGVHELTEALSIVLDNNRKFDGLLEKCLRDLGG